MRVAIHGCVVWLTLALASVAYAAPGPDPRAQLELADRLIKERKHQEALAAIDEGLAGAPKDLALLYLKGAVLLDMADYPGALAAFQAFVAVSPRGARRAEAEKIVGLLLLSRTTFLEVQVANGPADIYLNFKARGVVCRAAPSCRKALLPGSYKVIAERPGFERWTGRVTVAGGEVARLPIALAELPSTLAVRVDPPGAAVTVDGAPLDPAARIAAGPHQVAVSLGGYREERRAIEAREGRPIELEVSLAPLASRPDAPLASRPGAPLASRPDAPLLLDGRPLADDPAGAALAPGTHVLVARAPGYRVRRVAAAAARAGRDLLEVGPDRSPPRAGLSPRRELALGAALVAALAAGTGVALGVRSGQLIDGALERCPVPASPCSTAAAATALNARARTSALHANVAFGIAGGAALTAAVLWITGAPSPRATVSARLGGAAGLDLAVRF
jgi:hypothetical protein